MKKKIALLALLAAFPPLSTDMYLAAIPLLVKSWQQPLAIVNLTLIGFFITYCGFLLFYGPLSDRYGRRPPLLAGIGLYVVASLLCALADNVFLLIIGRIVPKLPSESLTKMLLYLKPLLDLTKRTQKSTINLKPIYDILS